jgi:aminocarboxymuconate-semialdehyde decarboxylase
MPNNALACGVANMYAEASLQGPVSGVAPGAGDLLLAEPRPARPRRYEKHLFREVVMQNTRVDFHTHFIPEHFPDMREKYAGAGWPALLHSTSCQADIYSAGRHYRRIDERSWNPERRLRDMQVEGVDVQVLSPIPVTFAYDFSAQGVLELAQMQNEEIARAVSASPEHFVGLGTVPLQDPHSASREVRRAVTALGLAGIEIGTNVQGRNLDDPALEPFWQACEEVGAAIFVHPASVFAPERTSKYRLVFAVGYTSETGIAASSIVMSGLLERHPTLRLCFAHGGGTFPWLLPRLDQAWRTFDDVRSALTQPPSQVAKQLSYDTLTYDTMNLRMLIDRLGVDRLLMGTDYPFPLREEPPGSVIGTLADLTQQDRAAMLGLNALRFLGHTC